jgi:hypothetical protein
LSGGERVDLFDVSLSAANRVVLRYKSTVRFDELIGSINDVVPVSDGMLVAEGVLFLS